MSKLYVLPCLDSERMAKARRQELQIPRDVAAGLGHSAVKAAQEGFYLTKAGQVMFGVMRYKLLVQPSKALP
jgi:hypothetical protein